MSPLRYFLTSFVLLSTLSDVLLAEMRPRILNGSTATTGTYPFMASVFVDTADGTASGACGGSLINSEWILTAAHCFLDQTQEAIDTGAASRTTVILGSDTQEPISSNAEVFSVETVIIHPDYNPSYDTSPNVNDNDIALVKLSGQSVMSPIAITSTGSIADGTETIIMGWGATGVNSRNESINPSNTLLEARQQTVSNTSCNSIYGGDITNNMLCAAGPTESPTTDTCQGDSGGPMLVSTSTGLILVGVVSFGGTPTGPACGDPEAPGVYTRVSQYNAFIKEYIPSITFAALDGISSSCSGTTIDSALNLSLACVVLDGTVFSTGLNIVDGQLAWEWNGEINDTSCSASDSSCVAPDSTLGLTMTGIEYEGLSNTLILNLDNSNDGVLRWNYQEHFAE